MSLTGLIIPGAPPTSIQQTMMEKIIIKHCVTHVQLHVSTTLSHWECILTPLVESVQSPPQRGGGKEEQGQGSSCLMRCPGGIHPSCGVYAVRVCACTYKK